MNAKTVAEHNAEIKRIVARGIAAQAMLRELKIKVLETPVDQRGQIVCEGLEQIHNNLEEIL